MTAASRQSGVEGTDGSVDLKAMPIDNVTISDAYDPGERAPTRLRCVFGSVPVMALLAQNRILGVWSGRGPLRDPSGSVAVLLLAAWIAGIGGRLGRGGR
ncbi:MAG TPA: hypothetical protein VJ305_11240 [Streptosporangiaceae bacterium]|nr:hypothetical protein [Streptosporangiaceae bacterium]